MKPYRTITTVSDSNTLLLEDLPFQSGEEVEVVVRPRQKKDPAAVEVLRKLFKETQNLPHIQKLTEQEIAAEIEAARSGQ